MEYPILGIKRITIGWNWLSYTREVNPVTNKLIRKGWYIKYITKLINNEKTNNRKCTTKTN